MSKRETSAILAWAILVLVAGVFAPRLGSVVQGGTDAIPGSLDASIIRLVLVPALIAVSGRWNGWLPGRRVG